jgi:hypothetical protein
MQFVPLHPDKRATIARCYDCRWLRAAAHGNQQQSSPTTYPAAVCEADLDHSRIASLVGLGHFSLTLFCSQNTVQLMTASMVHV